MKYFVCILVLSFSLASYAQSTCTLQNYDLDAPPDFSCPGPDELDVLPNVELKSSIPLSKGQNLSAPFDGAFVDKMRLIEVGLKLQGVRRLRWLDKQIAKQEAKVRLEFGSDLCNAKIDYYKSRINNYQGLLADSKTREEKAQVWYRSVWFGIIVGTITTAGLITLSAYLLHLVDS